MTSKIKLLLSILLANSIFVSFAQKLNVDSIFQDLPPYISVLNSWGNRPEWAINDESIYFLEKPVGDVFHMDLKTRKIIPVTEHFYNAGYNRVLCLANSDLLLCGNRKFNPEDPWKERHNLEMWVMSTERGSLPISLNEFCDEGPAVSRKNLTIAWTAPGQRDIYIGNIEYKEGKPTLINKKLLITYADSAKTLRLETQNFRGPNDDELIYTHYYQLNELFDQSETYGYNLKTGKVTNYTKTPNTYNEAEGIFPDGKHMLVESDRHFDYRKWRIDVYKVVLDGSGKSERLTYFSSRYPGVIADNPVVSDNGKYIAIQLGMPSLGSGAGRGLMLFDIAKYQKFVESRKNIGSK